MHGNQNIWKNNHVYKDYYKDFTRMYNNVTQYNASIRDEYLMVVLLKKSLYNKYVIPQSSQTMPQFDRQQWF